MKALVISSCTKRKRYAPPGQPDCPDLDDPVRRMQKEQELHAYKLRAIEMYTGQHHLHVREGLELVWNKLGHESVSLVILSAGYGVLQPGQLIIPYECTFRSMKRRGVIARSHKLGIRRDIEKLVQGFDLIFYLLGKEYLWALEPLPLTVDTGIKQFFFVGQGFSARIPEGLGVFRMPAGSQEARQHRQVNLSFKGYLFKLLCQRMIQEGLTFASVYQEPDLVHELVAP
ncbi:MAG: hypothetical protein E3J21_19660 [Anaerolineales bacterium]|nr:MAG: hypothetical protein E3J21_19660 [Anaerolineales bacterium]